MSKNFIKLITVILIIGVGLMFSGLSCPPGKKGQEEEIVLNWWRVNFDDSKTFKDTIDVYQEANPKTKIVVKTLTFSEYEEELVDALSASTAEENKGPDILSIQNSWLPRWQNRLLPIPKADDIYEHQTFRQFEDTFVETVVSDFSADGQIYALPLYVDTLALFYNKDLLDNAGIAKPPATWNEFSEAVQKLTKLEGGTILQSGAAIGTSTNINRSTDILELLMMQNGTQMTSPDKSKMTFNNPLQSADGAEINPGQIATTYYTDFANAQKDVYTWNLNQDYSIDAFVAGKTAMMFNYSFRQETLRTKSANLNYRLAPMPQIDSDQVKMNYPNYWGEAVSNKTLYPNQSWDFVEFLTNYENSKNYLETTSRPPARRDLIDEVRTDPILGLFAEQALSARNWWKPDNRQIEAIFATMIESINLGQSSVEQAMSVAQQSAQQLIKKD